MKLRLKKSIEERGEREGERVCGGKEVTRHDIVVKSVYRNMERSRKCSLDCDKKHVEMKNKRGEI